jgi:cysteinyl-tRNA synthetase
MSKSLKNFITIRELLKKYRPEALRVMVASTHYRKELMYTEKLIDEATVKINSIYAALTLFYNHIETTAMEPEAETLKTHINEFQDVFRDAMRNDFDTPKALNSLVLLANEIRLFVDSGIPVQKSLKDEALKKISELSHTIGILKSDGYKEPLPKDARELILTRESNRKQNKFDDADSARKRLRNEFNIALEDSKTGPIWYWMVPKAKLREN